MRHRLGLTTPPALALATLAAAPTAANACVDWQQSLSALGLYPLDVPAHAVEWSPPYAYFTESDGSSLSAIDFSVPDSPVLLGTRVLSGLEETLLATSETRLVTLGSGGRLWVWDLFYPSAPHPTAFMDGYEAPTGLALDATRAVVTDANGLHVVDTADSSAPALRGELTLPDSSAGVACVGDHAYVATPAPALLVVDLSDPDAPVPVDTVAAVAWTERAVAVEASADRVVVLTASALHVFTGGAAGAPTLAGSIDLAAFAPFAVSLDGPWAFVVGGVGRSPLVDLTDPTNPTLDGAYPFEDVAAADLTGDRIMVSWGSPPRLGLFETSTIPPASPETEIAFLETAGEIRASGTEGDLTVVVERFGGLHVFDTSDSSRPVRRGFVDLPHNAERVVVRDSLAYVANYASGLQIVDLSDPDAPIVVGRLDTPGRLYDVALRGDHVFCADFWYGLEVVDVSDPTSPRFVGGAPHPEALSLEFVGPLLYVGAGHGKLGAYDVSDPARPALVREDGSSLGSHFDLAVLRNHRLYSAAGTGILVYDVSAPDVAVYMTTLPLSAKELAMGEDDILYVATQNGEVQAYSLQDPLAPELIGRVSYDAVEVDPAPWGLAVTSGDGTLRLVHGHCPADGSGPDRVERPAPEAPARYPITAVPNPFRSRTSLSFGLAEAGEVRFEVFDVSGRLRRTFVVGSRHSSGAQVRVWDGRDDMGHPVPAGVYFLRLETEGRVESGRVVRIR